MSPFYFFDCFSNSKSSHARHNVVSRTHSYCPLWVVAKYWPDPFQSTSGLDQFGLPNRKRAMKLVEHNLLIALFLFGSPNWSRPEVDWNGSGQYLAKGDEQIVFD
jgi:hypothetical protein